MTDEMLEAGKTADYQFRTQLASIDSPERLRAFVDTYFATPSEQTRWRNLSIIWGIHHFPFWNWPAFKEGFPEIAAREWDLKKRGFKDERIRLGFIIGGGAYQ